jgi:anthranilate phosphoribosyltransferase
LVNPAGARYQLLGAGRPELRPLLAGAVAQLGTKRTLVVSGDDGLGDITLAGATQVSEVVVTGSSPVGSSAGELPVATARDFTWQPADFGIGRSQLDSLHVDSPVASAAIVRKVLAGEPGPARDIVVLNAAAGLIVAGKTAEPKAAAALAANAIDAGAAAELLQRLAARSYAPA